MRPMTQPPRAEEETDAVSQSDQAGSPRALAPFARWPVLAIAGGFAVLLFATITRYGYFGDELYFRVAGYHLDWSFPDQPPLLPLLAGLMDRLFPGSLAALRFPAVVCTVGGVVVTALLARELGGARRAQLVAATAFVASPFMTLFGRYLLTSTVDVVLTATITWLLVRWVRTRDDRVLLVVGLVAVVGLQAKMMIVIVIAALLVGLLICGPRALLTRRKLWIGGGIALLTAVPMLIWQATHGWPQLHMGDVLKEAAKDKMFGAGPTGFVIGLAVFCGFAGLVLLGYGVWRLAKNPDLRFFLVTFVLLTALFIALDWSSYYVAALFPVLWAAGAVGLDRFRAKWVPWVLGPAAVFAVVPLMVLFMPLQPLESVSDADRSWRFDVQATVGWPELVADIAKVYNELPDGERARAVVVTETYEPASAVDRYGDGYGLPTAYSPYLGMWYFATPPDSADVMVFVGEPSDQLRDAFSSAERVGRTDNDQNVDNSFQHLSIWVLRGQTEPWSQLWPGLRVP
ncbi:ArnT family glycosyltransferase [Actinophytocola sp.]|uniref:ArnT family glycosyltransferase n=1 Tax=Actinophytocola sp. TaxID=1872138 RepID=UPI002ED92AD6